MEIFLVMHGAWVFQLRRRDAFGQALTVAVCTLKSQMWEWTGTSLTKLGTLHAVKKENKENLKASAL